MKKLLIAIVLLLGCLAAPQASAQTSQYWLCQTASQHPPSGSVCPTSIPYPLPVTQSGGTPQTILGFQNISSSTLASATAPTVPTGTTHMDIYPEGTAGTNNQCLRMRDDGTAPTASTGAGLAPQQDILGWSGSFTNVQFINATGATCTLTLRYWK